MPSPKINLKIYHLLLIGYTKMNGGDGEIGSVLALLRVEI
jgi:hypothetical protein